MIEETSREVVSNLPRVLRDVEAIKQEARLLQDQMKHIKQDVRKVIRWTAACYYDPSVCDYCVRFRFPENYVSLYIVRSCLFSCAKWTGLRRVRGQLFTSWLGDPNCLAGACQTPYICAGLKYA